MSEQQRYRRMRVACSFSLWACLAQLGNVSTVATSAAGGPASVGAGRDLVSPVTVEDALRFAWYRHPAMRSRRLELERAGASRVIAGLWPDPVLGMVVAEEVDQKRTAGVSLAQAFELGGKRGARVDQAEVRNLLAEANLLDTWLSVCADIREGFSWLAYTAAALDLADRQYAFERERSALVLALHRAGRLPESKQIVARMRESNAEIALRQAEAAEREAGRRLVAAVGQASGFDGALWMPSSNSVVVVTNDFSSLARMAREGNAAVLTAQARAAIAQANRRMARALRWPDLTLSIEGRSIEFEDGGETEAYGLGLRMPLPWSNRRREDLDNAERAVDAAEADGAATMAAVVRELADLVAAYEKLRAESTALDLDQIPLAKRHVRLAEALQQSGKASRLDVIGQQLEMIAVQSRGIRSAWLATVAAIQLERVAGVAGREQPVIPPVP